MHSPFDCYLSLFSFLPTMILKQERRCNVNQFKALIHRTSYVPVSSAALFFQQDIHLDFSDDIPMWNYRLTYIVVYTWLHHLAPELRNPDSRLLPPPPPPPHFLHFPYSPSHTDM